MAEILNILTLVLGAVQICDIFIAIGLYFIYNKSIEYLYVIFLWVGMCLMFILENTLGTLSLNHPFMSYAMAGFTGISMAGLLSKLYKVNFCWKKYTGIFIALYLISLGLRLVGVTSFLVLSAIISIGVTAPVFITSFGVFKNLREGKVSGISIIDYIFLGVIVVWALHFLDYPFLRPLEDLKFSIFGFSFALFLTYLTSILIPVVVNRRIFLTLNDTLAEKLDHKTSQLTKVQNQIIAREKLASLGSLTAGIAHEIKNPLNIIKNGTYMYNKFAGKNLSSYKDMIIAGENEKLQEKITADIDHLMTVSEMVNRNVDRADTIIKNMLKQSRTGESSLSKEDVNKLVVENFEFVIQSTKSRYSFQIESEFKLKALEPCMVYSQDLGRAVINILDNALYAMNERFKQKFIQPKVIIETYCDEKFIYIQITDNGPGIPKEEIEKILDPFYTTKPTGEGTGLGLSMVFEVIKMHEGDINIQSEPNIATTFLLKISKHLEA